MQLLPDACNFFMLLARAHREPEGHAEARNLHTTCRMGPVINKGLLALALAGIAAGVWHVSAYAQRRRRALPSQTIDRWEGEGGNVPAVATPSPAPQPAASVPPDVQRH